MNFNPMNHIYTIGLNILLPNLFMNKIIVHYKGLNTNAIISGLTSMKIKMIQDNLQKPPISTY